MLGRNAVHGSHDIVSREICAIVELHALAKGKAPELVINQLPFGCQRRLDLEVRAVADQTFVNVVQESQIGCGWNRIRIERIDIRTTAPT